MKVMKTYEAFLGGESKPLLPEPAQIDLKSVKFNVPVKVSKQFDESVFGYYSNISDIVSEIEKQGVDAYWLIDSFNSWKNYKIEEFDAGEEPERDDFEDEDDYQSEYDEWEERSGELEKYENDDNELLDEYVGDEFSSWDSFLNDFAIDALIDDTDMNRHDKQEIFTKLQEDWNKSDMVQYFDEAEELGIANMQVVGDNFKKGKFTIEVKVSKDLTEDELTIVEDWISGQCSDGWGEGFEQQEIGEGNWSVSTWWGDDKKFGEYKIEIEK